MLAFFSGFGWGGEVYKSMEWYVLLERGGAARLARGAHNPEVGSSNLPPATISVVKVAAYSGFFGGSLFRVNACSVRRGLFTFSWFADF